MSRDAKVVAVILVVIAVILFIGIFGSDIARWWECKNMQDAVRFKMEWVGYCR